MLLGFYQQFVHPVEDGSKTFTIRDWPKRIPKIGERLHMYTGSYRQKRTLITREHCLVCYQKVKIRIKLLRERGRPKNVKGYFLKITVDKRVLRMDELQEFFIRDGFKGEGDFIMYWTNKLKKDVDERKKIMYHWTDFKY